MAALAFDTRGCLGQLYTNWYVSISRHSVWYVALFPSCICPGTWMEKVNFEIIGSSAYYTREHICRNSSVYRHFRRSILSISNLYRISLQISLIDSVLSLGQWKKKWLVSSISSQYEHWGDAFIFMSYNFCYRLLSYGLIWTEMTEVLFPVQL